MTLRKSVWVDAPLDIVRGHFTDAAKMALWCGRAAEIDARPGGVYRLDMGEGGWLKGRFTEVGAARICWEVDIPGGAGVTMIEVALRAEAGGTRVDVTQSGLPSPFDAIAGRGWDHHLARLSVAATGGTNPPDPLCARPMASLADPA